LATNRTLTRSEYKKLFNKQRWIIVSIIVITLNVLSGAGGLFYQNWDYQARNAVFSDLIQNDWPVTYDYENTANQFGMHKGILTYYFAWFIPSALVGKAFGFTVGSLFLLLQQIVGCLLFFYLLFRYFRQIKVRFVVLFFIFSGIDIVGRMLLSVINGGSWGPLFGTNHIDTPSFATSPLVFASFTTQLFWIFNTAVPAWIMTVLLLNEKDFKFIGLLLLFLIPFTPLPAIGLVLLIIILALFKGDRAKVNTIKSLFSLQNVLCLLPLLPIAMLFLSNSGGQAKGLSIVRVLNENGITLKGFLSILIIYSCEMFILMIIINRNNRRLLLSYMGALLLVSLFFVGQGQDLSSKGSIPLLVAIYILFCDYILEWGTRVKSSIQNMLVVAMLILGGLTPAHEIMRSIDWSHLNDEHHVSNYATSWKTFSKPKSNEMLLFLNNFVSPYQSKSILAKYVLR